MPRSTDQRQDNRQTLALIAVALLAAALIGVASVVFYRDPVRYPSAPDAGIAHRP